MKKNNIIISIVSFLVVLGLIGPITTFAATATGVPLGSIDTNNIVVLGKTAITDVPASIITGNIGISPATGAQIGVTCPEISGSIYTVDALTAFAGGPGGSADNTCVMAGPGTNKTLIDNAVLDMGTAYTYAAGEAAGTGAFLNIGTPAGTVGTMTLAPGVYTWGSNVDITNNVTLSGGANDVWVFQVTGTLTLNAGKSIILTGGAQAKNVFWQVTGTTNLLAGSNMVGIILDQTNIAMVTGATLNGKALAQTAVTLESNTIGISASAAPITSHRYSAPSAPVPTIPIIGITKVPSPLSLPLGPGEVTYNYTVSNIGGQTALTDVSVVDDKCSPVTLVSGNFNGDEKLYKGADWKYTCTTMLTSTTANTAIATGYSDDSFHTAAIATAISTVVVGTSLTPPLINIVKVPSQLTALPFGGGNITYTYTVTNPGVVSLQNVSVVDNKCSTVTLVSGDSNNNGLLDTNETWKYTCTANVPVSTASVATAKGNANGLTALAYSFVNVLVSTPTLPNTGFSPAGITISWITIILTLAVIVLAIWLTVVIKKGKNKTKV
jgi:uncharacterized repeat protein (TIGR01451 family)